MKPIFALIAKTTLILLISLAAQARICVEDSQRLCPGLGETERQECMKKNVSKWSQKCKDEFQAKLKENSSYAAKLEQTNAKIKEIKKDQKFNEAYKKIKDNNNDNHQVNINEKIKLMTICREKKAELRKLRDSQLNELSKNRNSSGRKLASSDLQKKRNEIRNQYYDQIKLIPECKYN